MPKRYGPVGNKKAKIICRICGPQDEKGRINRQSYRDHLMIVHKDTSGDLREYGQSSVFSLRNAKEVNRNNIPSTHEGLRNVMKDPECSSKYN